MHDFELVRAAQSGDRAAFGQLVERYRAMVFGLCCRMAGNRTDAEDLAHDAFIGAFLKIGQLEAPERFGGWLRTLTLNVCRMWCRRKQAEIEEVVEELPAAENGEMDYLRMISGLSRLAPEPRMVLVLHYWEGWSYEDIARFMEVPLGTVMSRLHRARKALKNIVQDMEEEIMAPDEEFNKAIEAEIEVLLRLFGEDRASMERLGEILEKSPERFAGLVRQMEPGAEGDFALLLKRLGRPALEVALECYFSDDAAGHGGALMLLRALAAADRDWFTNKEWRYGECDVHATVVTYLLLDLLIARPESAVAKAELLVELMVVARDNKVAAKYSKVLLCHADVALAPLLERFWEADEVGLGRSPLAFSLCALGTPFCAALLEVLHRGDARRRERALEGLGIFAYRLDPRGGNTEEQIERLSRDARFPEMRPLLSRDIDVAVLRQVGQEAMVLLDCADAELRDQAIYLLGQLKVEEAVERVRQCLRHEEQSTRLAAIRALADMGAEDGVALLEQVVREGSEAEQCAAIGALGRMGAVEAQAIFMDLAEKGTAPKVREEAINGLGQIGGEEAHAFLRRLMRTGDKNMRKKAARWMTGKKYEEAQGLDRLVRGAEAEKDKRDPRRTVRARRVEKLRGAAAETLELTYVGMDRGLRALPEMRPYHEFEFTQYLAQVCYDYSFTRRLLADKGLIERRDGVCELTETGAAAWRVEHFIGQNYLTCQARLCG